jgi:hypothetical protein
MRNDPPSPIRRWWVIDAHTLNPPPAGRCATAREQSSRLRRALGLAALGLVFALPGLRAITLNDLLADSKMTPKRFASHFDEFDFEYNLRVQNPDAFLRRQKGDCADYAILGDYVLKQKKYSTRLIRVVLVGSLAHDVCYVFQVKAYLDYNNRAYFTTLQRSGRTIREIADNVADSFQANWTSASVYTYDYTEDLKHLTLTVVKTEPAAEDPDVAGAPAPP